MEALVRFAVFFAILLIMILWEWHNPKRRLSQNRRQRWVVNLGMGLFNIVLLQLTVGGIIYQSALIAAEHRWGLLNQGEMPDWMMILITFLVLDFAIYLQHVVSHKWQWLWRLHRVHHSDIDFDTTTAIRFHPLEIIISTTYKVGLIYALGADPTTVIAFEIILNGSAMFNHGNVAIPEALNRVLCWFIITPDMHRIHHSALKSETDSNYGFLISCWDRFCGTYIGQSQHPQTEMDLGLADFRNLQQLGWMKLLQQPFLKSKTKHS